MSIKKQDLIQEIATRARSLDYGAFFQYLPNPDPVLKKMGRDISTYREIMADASVSAAVKRRKAAIKRLNWRIVEGTPDQAKKIETLFSHFKMRKIMSEMLEACLFGYQPLENMWTVQDGLYLPTDIVGKPPEWFLFDTENRLRFRTKENILEGELLPDRKFLIVVQNGSYQNPYGLGDLAACFWPAVFKKGGLKYWLQFIEKYASPWVIGKHPRNATQQETDKLLDALEVLTSSSVGAIPNDSSVDIMEPSGKGGSSDAFDRFMTYCRGEINIALLGQNQTTEADTNHASAVAGLEVAENIRDDDVALIEETLNQLIDWICELNFTGSTRPRFELYEQESVDKLQAERDELLTKAGARFSNQYFARNYNLKEGDLLSQQNAVDSNDFAESSNILEPELVLEKSLSLLPNPILPWREQILNLFREHGPDVAQDKLVELMPELNDAALAELLTRIIFVSELYGRLTAQAEQHESV